MLNGNTSKPTESINMKVNQRKVSETEVKLQCSATPADVAKALQMAGEAFARTMGLSPDGKTTVAEAVEKQFGIKDLDSLVAESAKQILIVMALDKKNIIPAFLPELKTSAMPRRGMQYDFELEVELKPKYELTSYEPLEIEAQRFEFDESQVDAELQNLAAGYTAYVKDDSVAADRVVADGDYIKVAMEASQDGQTLPGLTADSRIYLVGAGHMPASFDQSIFGMKTGETREFDFGFDDGGAGQGAGVGDTEIDAPDIDGEGAANSTNEPVMHAKVTVLEFLKEQKPQIDDEWVSKNAPMYKDAAALRADLKSGLEERDRENYEAYLRSLAVEQLAKRFEGKIEDSVYESMFAQMRQNMENELAKQGMKWEDYIEQSGGENQVQMMMMLEARQTLVQGFSLDAIYRHFKLSVDNSDIEHVCHLMNPNADPRAMRISAEESGQSFALREMAERYKANQYVVDHANITYTD